MCVCRISCHPRSGFWLTGNAGLMEKAKQVEGVTQWPYKALAIALEVIPRTLAQNCGAHAVRLITQLRAKHASDPLANRNWGIDGDAGVIVDMGAKGTNI